MQVLKYKSSLQARSFSFKRESPDCPSLRASDEHRFIVRVLRARRMVWRLPLPFLPSSLAFFPQGVAWVYPLLRVSTEPPMLSQPLYMRLVSRLRSEAHNSPIFSAEIMNTYIAELLTEFLRRNTRRQRCASSYG